MKPCLSCGEPTSSTRCDDCTGEHERTRRSRTSARSRGYDTHWDKLSRRARKLQPWCSDCHTTEDLTTDHKPSAWRRKAEGKPLRLRDVDVCCQDCNAARGSSRPGSDRARVALDPARVDPPQAIRDHRRKAQNRLHTPGGYR